MKKLLRIAAATAMTVGLTAGAGIASAQSTITETGYGSKNVIVQKNTSDVDVHSTNNLGVNNSGDQSATSGNVTSWANTEGGDAASGDASNTSSTMTHVMVSNPSASAAVAAQANAPAGDQSATIDTTGFGSTNKVIMKNSTDIDVTSTNNVTVNNSGTQSATSGTVNSSANTEGGSAQSGNASNTKTVETTVSISN